MSAERKIHDIEVLSAYLDGQLTVAERLALETRLQNEPDLRQQLAELRATVALIRELPTMSAPRDFRLTHAMVSASRQGRQPRTYAFSFVSAAAAIVLFVLGFGLLSSSMMSTTAPLASSNFASDGLVATSQPPQVAILPTQTQPPTIDVLPLQYAATDIIEQEETLADEAAEDARSATDAQQAQATPLPAATMLFEPTMGADAFAGAEGAANTGTAIEEFSTAAEQADEEAPAAELLLQAPAESDTAAASVPLPTQSEAPAMLALQPTGKPTEMPAATLAPPSPTPLPTETASLTPTSAPTATSEPTSTVFPTPVPQPLQVPASPTDTGALGVILIAVSIVLLAAAIYFLLRGRGQ